MIDDMNMRRFSRETQRNYVRDVGRFATFLGRSFDTATPDDVRQFQIDQREAGGALQHTVSRSGRLTIETGRGCSLRNLNPPAPRPTPHLSRTPH
jgi:hypothetical protein